MKQYAFQYFGREDGYEIYYYTQKQKEEKFHFFETLEELRKWCAQHKGKVRVKAGSWQALELLK